MSTKMHDSIRGDQITVASLSIDRVKGTGLKAMAGIVDSSTGQTHAWMDGDRVTWSSETTEVLEKLMGCIERDLLRAHFTNSEGAAASSGGPSPTESSVGLNVPASGLGEHVGSESGPKSI